MKKKNSNLKGGYGMESLFNNELFVVLVLVSISFLFVAFCVLLATIIKPSQELEPHACDQYAHLTIEDVPAKCYSYFLED